MSETQNPVASAVNAVQQNANSEQPQTTPTAPEAQDPKLDLFARKERQLRKLQVEIANERKAMEANKSKYDQDYVPKSRLKEDPLSVLSDAGISYDQLTEILLNQPNQNDPATKAMLNKIKALEEKEAQRATQAEEASKAQYQQALKQIDNEVRMLVDSDSEFESIKEAGMQAAVTELIEQTFQSTGELLGVRDAALEVENHLVEESFKMSQLKKVQARMKPVTEPVSPVVAQKQTPSPVTITNNMPTKPANRSAEKERIARALAAFKGELK